MVNCQPSGGFLCALIFLQDILTHFGHYFFVLCTQIQDNEKRNIYDKLSLIKVSKGCCPKALDDFVDDFASKGASLMRCFSAPEPKAQVHYCDHALSVVRRPSVRPSVVRR